MWSSKATSRDGTGRRPVARHQVRYSFGAQSVSAVPNPLRPFTVTPAFSPTQMATDEDDLSQ